MQKFLLLLCFSCAAAFAQNVANGPVTKKIDGTNHLNEDLVFGTGRTEKFESGSTFDFESGANFAGSASAFRTAIGAGTAQSTRSIATTAPLAGGGDLSADRTLSIANAAADGTTKGAAAFGASDFDAISGVISLDYTNGQTASASAKGFLAAADWSTFSGKYGSGSSPSFAAASATSIADSGLTSGRVPFASTGGLLADSSAFAFDGGTGQLAAASYALGATTPGVISGTSGAVTITAAGTNKNITLTPSGTGIVSLGNSIAGGGGSGQGGLFNSGGSWFVFAQGVVCSPIRGLGFSGDANLTAPTALETYFTRPAAHVMALTANAFLVASTTDDASGAKLQVTGRSNTTTLNVGAGSTIDFVRSGASTKDFPEIAGAGGTQDLTTTITGATVGDSCIVAENTATPIDAGIVLKAWVTAADTVTIRATNTTASPIDPASVSLRITVISF